MLCSEFRIFYLDDVTLGGNEADVWDDFKMIEREAAVLVWSLIITNQNSYVQINLVLLFCTWHLTYVESGPTLLLCWAHQLVGLLMKRCLIKWKLSGK